jgi:hypothetical protein
MATPFNDTTNYSGHIQDCESWLFGSDFGAISGNTNKLKQFATLLNYALDEVTNDIIEVDNTWQWDDSNHIDYPIATTSLVAGQKDYVLETTHLNIQGVEVKDSNGDYYPLSPIDYRNIRNSGQSETEFFEQDGRPMFYDLQGESLFLYPAPDANSVTTASGLKIFFQRPASYFASTDTTKAAGISPIFQDLITLYACAKYAKQNSMADKARELDAEITKRKAKIRKHYYSRTKDTPKKITYKHRNPK